MKTNANIDELTGLKTPHFLEDVKILFDEGTKLVLIDIDKFDNINKTFGNEKGDKALKVFANKLRELFENSIIIRYDGDAFLIISNEDIKILKEKTLKLKNDLVVDDKIKITASSGISSFSEFDIFKEALNLANIRMLKTKI